MLDYYASVAEIVAVLFVVALLYVARQLKQTTNMMRVAVSNARVEREYDILSSAIENREVAEYWVKGGSDGRSVRTGLKNVRSS